MSGGSFQYTRAADLDDARIQASKPGAVVLAGGTDLLQLWKSGAMTPVAVVDISRLPLARCGIQRWPTRVGRDWPGSAMWLTHPDVSAISSVDRGGDPGQRQRADPQYGDGRRQSVAANALPVFSQPAACLQQAKARQRMWRDCPARAATQRCSAQTRHASRHMPRTWPLRLSHWTPRSRCSGQRVSGASRCAISTGCPVRRRSMKRSWRRANSSLAFT